MTLYTEQQVFNLHIYFAFLGLSEVDNVWNRNANTGLSIWLVDKWRYFLVNIST